MRLALLLAAAILFPTLGGAHASMPDPVTYIVGFHALPDEARASSASFGGDRVIRIDEALGFALVETRDAPRLEARAASDPNVRYWRADAPDALSSHIALNDPLLSQQYAWTTLNASPAWATTTGSTSILVAVLDSGVDGAHEDLAGGRVLPGWSFLTNDANTVDDCGHGTHVAGTLGATAGNALGGVGAAQVTILPVKVLGKSGTSCVGSFGALASGIRYAADRGADVITMSLGCLGCQDPAAVDAIEYAWSKGALLIASAGNSGACTDCVSFPADQPRVLAIACTDNRDTACSFSSAGPEVDLAAPGLAIASTHLLNSYKTMSGTSMSAPHIAGGAALAISANPALTNAQLRSLLESSVRDAGAPGPDEVYGRGVLDIGRLVAAANGPLPNAPPVAAFTYSCSFASCAFDATPSHDPEGGALSYAWDFGDGSSGAGTTASHAYASGGDRLVTLRVTDGDGASETTTRALTTSEALRLAALAGGFEHARKTHSLTWRASLAEPDGASVPGANVTARLTTSAGTAVALWGITGPEGVATFTYADKTTKHGAFTLCILGATKPLYAYDAAGTSSCLSVTTA